jgi:hypothetical protein
VSARARPVRHFMTVAGLISVLVASAACGDDDDLPPPASPPPADGAATSPPAPTLDARDAEAWEEIQTKFDGFMETWIKWAAEGSPGGFEDPAIAELNEYADILLRDEVGAELIQDSRDGRRRTGRPVWSEARPLEFDWDREVQDQVVPEAIFEVCVDDTEWIVVDADSGEPIGGEQAAQQLWTVTAWWAEQRDFGPEGWALAQREIGGSC